MARDHGGSCLCGHDAIVHAKVLEKREGPCRAYTCKRDGLCKKLVVQLPGAYRPWPKYDPALGKKLREARKIKRKIWYGAKA